MTLGINVDRLLEIHALAVGDDLAALTERTAASAPLTAIIVEMDAHVGDVELHASLLEKASVLAAGIVRAVPFHTGNWKTAAAAVDIFLTVNGVDVDLGNAHDVDLWLYDLAEKELDVVDAVAWLAARVRFP